MKLIIDIDEQHFEILQSAVKNGMGDNSQKIIANGISIPDNATNGDMIKAFYPDAKYDVYFDFIAMTTHTERTVFMSRFDRDWWNAPYKAERSDKE